MQTSGDLENFLARWRDGGSVLLVHEEEDPGQPIRFGHVQKGFTMVAPNDESVTVFSMNLNCLRMDDLDGLQFYS